MTPAQARAAAILAQDGTQAEAARAAELKNPSTNGTRTIRRWLTDPAFRAAARPAPADEDGIHSDHEEDDVLRALLRSPREEIRLRAAIALRRHRLTAPAAQDKVLQVVLFGPRPLEPDDIIIDADGREIEPTERAPTTRS